MELRAAAARSATAPSALWPALASLGYARRKVRAAMADGPRRACVLDAMAAASELIMEVMHAPPPEFVRSGGMNKLVILAGGQAGPRPATSDVDEPAAWSSAAEGGTAADASAFDVWDLLDGFCASATLGRDDGATATFPAAAADSYDISSEYLDDLELCFDADWQCEVAWPCGAGMTATGADAEHAVHCVDVWKLLEGTATTATGCVPWPLHGERDGQRARRLSGRDLRGRAVRVYCIA